MSTSFTVRHTFDIDPEGYWRDVFFDDDFNKNLYLRDLGFGRWDIIEPWHEEASGVKVRKIRTEPKADAPKAVKKVIGDSLTYVESGRFDPKTERYTFDIEPSKMADKVHISGEFWVEPRDEARASASSRRRWTCASSGWARSSSRSSSTRPRTATTRPPTRRDATFAK